MIVYALSQLPGLEGTALQIFDVIEGYAPFVDQLDTRIMPGTKHVPRCAPQGLETVVGT